jgi:hypothetical protein
VDLIILRSWTNGVSVCNECGDKYGKGTLGELRALTPAVEIPGLEIGDGEEVNGEIAVEVKAEIMATASGATSAITAAEIQAPDKITIEADPLIPESANPNSEITIAD